MTEGKLVGSTFMSLDGVIDNPMWTMDYWDDEHSAYAASLMEPADALLCGRVTYEGFIQAWPQRSGDWYTDKINSMPKYVASRTLTETSWNATVIEGDLVEQVRAVKEKGTQLLKFGTGVVDIELLAAGLIDELHLWIFPVVVGSGVRLMEGIETTHLKLVDSHRMASGITVQKLVPKTD